MKNLTAGFLGLLFGLCSLGAAAQKEVPVNEPEYNKPKLFADLPDRVPVNLAALETLLNLPEGQAVSTPFTSSFRFQGVVVSKSHPADTSVKSVVIRSTNRFGATFTFTRIRTAAGTFEYIGRILSLDNSDAFELVQERGRAFFEKRHLYDLFNE